MAKALEQFLHTYDGEYDHPCLVNHRGTVIAFAMDSSQRIVYSVLDQRATPTHTVSVIDAHNWLDQPIELEFPDEIERVGLEDAIESSPTGRMTSDAPFQVASDNHHVYLFRQANTERDWGLLVDRFVMSGQRLVPTHEVRYRSSRSRTRPESPSDVLGATDLEDNEFVEPTKHLDFADGFSTGNFAVAILPSDEPAGERWQILTDDNETGGMRSYNLARGDDGFFGSDPEIETTVFDLDRRQPGYGFAARLYYEDAAPSGAAVRSDRQPHRVPRLLLCIASSSNGDQHADADYIAAVDFAVSPSGRLAELPTGTEIDQREIDREFVAEQAQRQADKNAAQEKVNALLPTTPPGGDDQVDFYTGEAGSGFPFTLYVGHQDRDVHARLVTASRPVAGGPHTDAAPEESVPPADTPASPSLNPDDAFEAEPPPVVADPERIRSVEFSNAGIIVELYPELDYGGEKTVMTESGPVDPGLDVKSVRVIADDEIVQRRRELAEQQTEIERLENETREATQTYRDRRGSVATDGARRVLLPFVDVEGRTAQEISDRLGELESSRSILGDEIATLERKGTELEARQTEFETNTQDIDRLEADVARLQGVVADRKAAVDRDADSRSDIARPAGSVRLLDRQGDLIFEVAEGSSLRLDIDRPEIKTVEVDAGLEAVFDVGRILWHTTWTTDTTTSDMPIGHFDSVLVRSVQVDAEAVRADDRLMADREALLEAEDELADKQQALDELKGPREQVAKDRVTIADQLTDRRQRLTEVTEELDRLREQRFGGPDPIPLVYHSTDGQGLTIRSALLGFAATEHQPVLFESAVDGMKLLFTGATGQLFSARLDHRSTSAQWDLPTEISRLQVRSASTDGSYNALTVSMGESYRPSLCNLTIANELDGHLEIWRDVPRDAEKLAQALRGETDLQPLSVPPRPGDERGSRHLAVVDAPSGQLVQNGSAEQSRQAVSPSWTAEPTGTALAFDGRAVVSAADAWTFSHGDRLTIEAWIRPTRVDREVHVVSSIDDSRSNYILGLTEAGPDTCRLFTEVDGSGVSSDEPLAIGAWHHVAVVFEAGRLSVMYIDGRWAPMSRYELQDYALARYARDFSLGGSRFQNGNPLFLFEGELDEVRVWHVARTHEQVLDNLFSRIPDGTAELDDLIAYYRFDHRDLPDHGLDQRGDMTFVFDSSPAANHLDFENVSKPTEVRSTAPVSVDAALVCCALGGIETSYHVDQVTGRPAIVEYSDRQSDPLGGHTTAHKRGYGFTTPGRWRLISGHKVGSQIADWVGQADFETEVTDTTAGEVQDVANTLLVPMLVKGIFADRPERAAGPTVDFTWLPWNDGHRDHNPDYAPLGEHLELPPMQNANGELQAGVHLHWTLPPVLCRPLEVGEHTVLPYIPVEWKVDQVEGGAYARTVWSDHIHPADTTLTDEHVAIPVPARAERPTEPPYRYMGKATTGPRPAGERMRDFYRDVDDSGVSHEHKLTSLGYGDPAFSSYYPNGREILGHHAPKDELAATETSTWIVSATLYDSNDLTSPLAELLTDTGLELPELLGRWGWPADELDDLEHITIAGAVEVVHSPTPHVPIPDNALDFAVGTTGTEALAAHLGATLSTEHGDARKIEEQLEAILMGNRIHGHAADLSFKFLEERHSQGYESHPGGKRWRITGPVDATRSLHARLAELNASEERAARLTNQLSSRKRELFADWYKYMLAKYPPPASLEQFDQMNYPTVGEAAAWLESHKRAIDELTTERNLTLAQGAEAQLVLQAEVDGLGDDVHLVHEPAAPFHSPNDPVVLISGLDLPEPHAAVALTPKRVALNGGGAAVRSAAETAWGGEFVAHEDGWSPFIMEWQAEFVPLVDGTSKAVPENRFTLHEHDVDADPRGVTGAPDPSPVNIDGRTYLSPGAKDRVLQSLAGFLDNSLAESDEDLGHRVAGYIATSQTPSDTDDAVLSACRAYEALVRDTILSQSLGGFHDALLQRERHLQPHMSDPLGSAAEQDFSHQIGRTVGAEERLAPNPAQPFLPIRAGSLRITGMRLIDVWGRYEDVIRDRQIEPTYAEPMRPFSHRPGWAGLRPRSTQPLRLRAELLVAGRDDLTIDEDPLASPVIGWVMANHMDRSLMWFEPNGASIASIDREGDESAAPGRTDAPDDQVAHSMEHLLKHARNNPAWVRSFLDATDDALAQIAPGEHLQHAGMSILAGRPLAVVRARLSFELMGDPAQNHSWDLFNEQLRAHRAGEPEHRATWQDMTLPVRLGSYRRLHDGLVGFWVEDDQGNHVGPLHSMASEAWGGEILGHDDPSALLSLPLNGRSVTVTMVLDPRGSVHVATGALPMVEMKLRLRDFQKPLQQMSTWYLQAPLLQPSAALHPPGAAEGDEPSFFAAPPHEIGLRWKWFEAATDRNATENGRPEWRSIDHFHPMRTGAHLEAPSELREGWLVLEHEPDVPNREDDGAES